MKKEIIITGLKLKNLRKLKGFSREKLADKLNVSLRSVENWERGKSKPLQVFQNKLKKIFKNFL